MFATAHTAFHAPTNISVRTLDLTRDSVRFPVEDGSGSRIEYGRSRTRQFIFSLKNCDPVAITSLESMLEPKGFKHITASSQSACWLSRLLMLVPPNTQAGVKGVQVAVRATLLQLVEMPAREIFQLKSLRSNTETIEVVSLLHKENLVIESLSLHPRQGGSRHCHDLAIAGGTLLYDPSRIAIRPFSCIRPNEDMPGFANIMRLALGVGPTVDYPAG